MKIHLSLSEEKARRSFMVFFLLSSLIPLLILIYIVFQYILPLLRPDQVEALRGWFTGGILVMLLFPLLGFVVMSQWMVSLENLTKEVRSKSTQIMEEQREPGEENEIFSLKHAFTGLYDELQEKMNQLDEYSKKLLESNQKLSELSLTDELTSLYNRRYFDMKLNEEMIRAERYGHGLALIMLDVDDFKQYNDTFGHQNGDKLLKGLGRLIRERTRQSDVCFRYGGDEFAILLLECNVETAEQVADRMVKAVSNHPFENIEKLSSGKVTISCGVASHAEHKRDFVEKADSLLLKAKEEGKDRAIGARAT